MSDPKIDDWLAEAKPEVIEVSICLDRELLTGFDRVSAEWLLARELKQERAKKFGESGGTLAGDENAEFEELERRMVELRERIRADEKEHVFQFKKMGYQAFREIIEAHPPTDEQRARDPWCDHNPNTAAPHLIVGSCVHPRMDLSRAEKLREVLPEARWADLYDAALGCNRGGVVIPKSVSSTVDRLALELKSTTHPNGDSPSPSSADE